MLQINSLSVAYGESTIVREVDLEVAPGQIVCLMGRNGVGKTTTLKATMGLLNARSGSVSFEGRDLTRSSPDVRAAARGMPAATYVAVLVRSHLRNLAPLPKQELLALKSAVAELGAIGRNLNQIARAMNQGGRAAGPGREELRAMLQVGGALRDHVKALLAGNAKSWDQGHAETAH